MKKLLLMMILVACISLPALADAPKVPSVKIPKITQGINVDGRLREEIWNQAAMLNLFHNVMNNQVADTKTLVFLMYDNVNLYIGFKFYEEDLPNEKSYQLKKDEPVFLDDSIEFFIDLQNDGESPYYHVVINPDGTVYDEIGMNHPEWDLDFTYKACRVPEDKLWNVEIAIPFAALNADRPGKGTVWGLNVNRNRYRLKRAHSAWALTPVGFHQPTLFGQLIFD